MNKKTMWSLLIVMILAVLAGYFVTRPKEKPLCDCFLPTTGEYGIKKDGNCVVTECKRKIEQ